MRKYLSVLNITLRACMELGIVCGFAYWGYSLGSTAVTKLTLGVVVPVVIFGIWGVVDFRQAGRFGEGLRLLEELLISGLAAVAVYSTGQAAFGWWLALLSVAHHILVYAIGERLLKARG